MDNGKHGPYTIPDIGDAGSEALMVEPDNAWLHRSRVLWDGRRLLLRVGAAALIISAIAAFVIPVRYKSTVRLMPPDSQNGAATLLAAMSGNKNLPGGLTALAGNLFGLKNTGALFTDLLGSRTVQERLVDRFQLQKVYWKRYREDACAKLADRTEVSEDRKSGVLTVSVLDHDPQRAQKLAEAYVHELDSLVSSVNTSSAHRERTFIEQRLVGVKQDLTDAESQFADFSSKNGTLDINQQSKAMVESAAELQGQLIAARSELESLQQTYSDNNIRVRSLRARIGELQRQLQKMSGTSTTVDSLPTGGSSELYPPLRHLPVLGIRWLDLYRRVKIQETVYELLTQQYELARIEEAKSIPVVRVIDPPSLPEKKSFPPRLLITLGGTALALICAGAWLLSKERWRELDASDPRKMFAREIGATTIERARIVLHRKRYPIDPAA